MLDLPADLLAGLPQSSVKTLVITDMVDSTMLTERLGDMGTAAVISRTDRVARSLLAQLGGREVDKSDGFLMLFDSVVDGVVWVLSYHAALDQLGAAMGLELAARAGLHVGEVVTWENPPDDVARGAKPLEVEGIAKPVAGRVSSAAGARQLLLTEAAWLALSGCRDHPKLAGFELGWREHGPFAFKGVSAPVQLFEVGEIGRAPLAPPPGSGKVRPWVNPNNLPPEGQAFVGRAQELDELDALLAEERLISLLGPGGTGKTRLSVEAARRALPSFPGGVWFCELEDATDQAGVQQIVARALDLPLTGANASARLVEALRTRGPTLLVLDNLEQVVGAATRVVRDWLREAPELRLLASSREPLQLRDERRYHVGALGLPPRRERDPDAIEAHPAVQLFVQRARQVRPDFALTSANAEVVAEIVRGLDGLPLAIELAAARARMLPVAAIRERLASRFELLRASSRDRSDRQATLEGAIDWSWALLDPAERLALAQLSVFRGGFTAEAAEAVVELAGRASAPATIDLLEALVDKSLVREHGGAQGPRLGFYSSIRAYAEHRLAEEGAVDDADGHSLTGPHAVQAAHARHARWFARFGSDEALAALSHAGGVQRRLELQRELDNLRLAARAPDPEAAARAALAAREVFELAGPLDEGADLLARTRRLDGQTPALAARLEAEEGGLLKQAGRAGEAEQRLRSALAALTEGGDPGALARVRLLTGYLFRDSGRPDDAVEHLDAARRAWQRLRDPVGEGLACAALATVDVRRGRLDQAEGLLDEALRLQRAAGNRRSEAHVLSTLGSVHAMRGRLEQARPLLEGALARHQEVGNRKAEGVVCGNLAYLHYEQGDLARAAELLSRALTLHREVGNRRSEASSTAVLARVRRAQQAPVEASQLAHAALDLARQVRSRRDEALAVMELAELARQAGDLEAARDLAETGIDIARDAGGRAAEGELLGLLGECLCQAGQARGLDALDEGQVLLERSGLGSSVALLECRRARALLSLDRREEARRCLGAAQRSIARLGLPEEGIVAQELRKVERVLT